MQDKHTQKTSQVNGLINQRDLKDIEKNNRSEKVIQTDFLALQIRMLDLRQTFRYGEESRDLKYLEDEPLCGFESRPRHFILC